MNRKTISLGILLKHKKILFKILLNIFIVLTFAFYPLDKEGFGRMFLIYYALYFDSLLIKFAKNKLNMLIESKICRAIIRVFIFLLTLIALLNLFEFYYFSGIIDDIEFAQDDLFIVIFQFGMIFLTLFRIYGLIPIPTEPVLKKKSEKQTEEKPELHRAYKILTEKNKKRPEVEQAISDLKKQKNQDK